MERRKRSGSYIAVGTVAGEIGIHYHRLFPQTPTPFWDKVLDIKLFNGPVGDVTVDSVALGVGAGLLVFAAFVGLRNKEDNFDNFGPSGPYIAPQWDEPTPRQRYAESYN